MAREKGMGSLQQEKSGRWTMRVCIHGKRYSRSTRTADRDKAEKFLQRFLAPLGLGERRLPMADVWLEYVKSPNRNDLAKSTLDAKHSVWMHFARWMEHSYLQVTTLGEVTHDMIAEYLTCLRADLCGSTYNNRVCVLREIFRTLVDKAGMEDDPWEGVRLRPDDSHSRRALAKDELQRLLEAARKYDINSSSSPNFYTLFLIGIYTGMRLGDCCCLQWSEISLERSIIQVLPRKVRKHLKGNPVTIPIHPELAAALGEATSSSYVLPTLATWYLGKERWRVGDGLGRIFKTAGIATSVQIEGRKTRTPEATFHSLRHTFVSFAANAGIPLHFVQSIVGHESTAMTRHYYHQDIAGLQRAVAAIPSVSEFSPGEATSSSLQNTDVNNSIRSGGDVASPRVNIAERLALLEELKAKGLVTPDEYAAQRQRILSEI